MFIQRNDVYSIFYNFIKISCKIEHRYVLRIKHFILLIEANTLCVNIASVYAQNHYRAVVLRAEIEWKHAGKAAGSRKFMAPSGISCTKCAFQGSFSEARRQLIRARFRVHVGTQEFTRTTFAHRERKLYAAAS